MRCIQYLFDRFMLYTCHQHIYISFPHITGSTQRQVNANTWKINLLRDSQVSSLMILLSTIGWQNLNQQSYLNATLAPQARQARPSGETLNYSLSYYSDILMWDHWLQDTIVSLSRNIFLFSPFSWVWNNGRHNPQNK